MATLPLGEWLPDVPNFANPGCVVAENCKPAPGGYGPFNGANNTTYGLTGTCKGAKLLFRSDATPVIVGGIDDKLFHLVGATLTETTGYTSASDDPWIFVQFGVFVVAINANNAPHYLTAIDSDTSFSALTGSPPTAATGGRVGNFLMLGNLSTNPYKIQWSAENDITDWTASATTGAGSAELKHEFGEVTGFGGNRFPLVFQKYGISRITPVGPPTIFRVEPIEEARGCIAPGSIVTVGFMTYFLAHDGFCVTDGNTVRRIGQQKIDDWFFAHASDADKFRTHGAIDWENQCIVWAFYPLAEAAYSRLLVYSWEQDRWSSATLTVDWLVENSVGAVTLEQMSTTYPNLDAVGVPSLDSAEFLARGRVLGAFINDGTDTELHTLNGASLAAEFETAEHQPEPGRRVTVTEIHPLVENVGENTEGRVITRTPKGGVDTYGTYVAIGAGGFCPVRADGRYVRIGMKVPSGEVWSKMQGAHVKYRVSGKR